MKVNVSLVVLLLAAHSSFAATVIFEDTFEDGAAGLERVWERRKNNGGEIEIAEAQDSGKVVRGKVVCISRENRNGLTFITRKLPSLTGTLRIQADIQAENVVSSKAPFKGGQFHAVVTVRGEEVSWPKADFEGDFGWTPHEFEVPDIHPTDVVVVRIGLQQGKGKMCVNNVRVTKID